MNDNPAFYKPLISSQRRRASWHNYYGRGTYMVTFSKQRVCPVFSTLEYTRPEGAFTAISSVGLIIQQQIEVTPRFNPEIRIHDYVIMPDHVHILLQVLRPMQRHLGDVVQAIKSASTSRIRRLVGNSELTPFEEGFHDRIVRDERQLETVRNYIRDNPRRLAERRAHPEFFRRVKGLRIGERECQAYGNMQLLECPFREQVVVHRTDSAGERESNRCRWLYTAANGGVLVSPFISPDEKAVREEAEALGGRFILLTNEPFGERYKPCAHDFALCETGHLLIISANLPGELSRQTCLTLNALAQTVANR